MVVYRIISIRESQHDKNEVARVVLGLLCNKQLGWCANHVKTEKEQCFPDGDRSTLPGCLLPPNQRCIEEHNVPLYYYCHD